MSGSGPKAQVAAVLAVHVRRDFAGDGYGWSVCAEDRQGWPCATVQAIQAAVCATCNGETWVAETVHLCEGSTEHECTEGCEGQIQVTCPSCTTLAERAPRQVPDEEPF